MLNSKVCNKCEIVKEFSEFPKDSRMSQGIGGTCKVCKNNENKLVRERRLETGYKQVLEKTCNYCGINKAIDLFFKDKAMPDGHGSLCKECKKKKTYEWREKNKDKYNSSQRSYQAANPEVRYGVEIKRRYGCTLEQYNAMVVAQDGACAICKRLHNPAEKRGRLYVDHNHSTGAVRALLCHNCNFMIGYAKEDPRILLEAVAYLARHKKP